MTVAQSNQLLNDSIKQAFGQEAIDTLDTTNLVNVGKFIGDIGTPRYDNWLGALMGRLYKVVLDAKKLTFKVVPFIRHENAEFGDFWEEVYPEWVDAIETESWKFSDPQHSRSLQPARRQLVSVKIYGKDAVTQSYEWNLPDVLAKNAFLNQAGLNAFYEALLVNIENAIDYCIVRYGELVRATYIAKCLTTSGTESKLNVLSAYKAEGGDSTLTATTCKRNRDYLRFRAEFINRYVDKFTTAGSHYINEKTANNNDYIRQVNPDDLVLEVLSEIALAMQYNLESDTYHDRLVKLPEYHEVLAWQGRGANDNLSDYSTIDLTIGKTALDEDIDFKQSGIIAVMYDKNAIIETYKDIHKWADYVGRDRMTYYGTSIDLGFAFKLSYPMVVFVEEDEVSP